MKFTAFLHKKLVDLLNNRRIVVWYDAEGDFKAFAASFNAPNCEVLSAFDSVLKARRRADEVYRPMNESDNPAESGRCLLIYLPRRRGATEDEKMRDPFEVYALAGAGEVEIGYATAVLPTVTGCGMAALMPGADGMLRLVEKDGGLVPALGTRLLKTSADRMKLLAETYGDRFFETTLDDLLSSPKKISAKLKDAVKETLTANYFRHDEANKAQSMVEQKGRHRFIDRVEVRFLASENKYWASMDHFGYTRIHIPEEFYRRYERLLVFIGNLNQPVESLVQNSATDLFRPLPKEFDLALLDRMHFYLPGWEVPKNSKEMLTVRYGFVTDYLAEAFRVLRKQNRFDETERVFRFGSHVEGRDATAVKKSVSGLLKILHPDGRWTKEDLTEYLELAMEGRRRIKEQLKKRGLFEFYKTHFSYIDLETDTERSVGVPEQGGAGLISQDPLSPGTVYTAAVNAEARVALLRLEVTLTAGTGKLRTPTGLERSLKESLNRAFSYLQGVKEKLGLTPMLAQKDLCAEAVDLSGGRIECQCGVAFFAAMISAIRNRQVQAGTVILGDLTIQGNVKGPASITEPLQPALESGAVRVLVPVSNKTQFAGLPEDVIDRLDSVLWLWRSDRRIEEGRIPDSGRGGYRSPVRRDLQGQPPGR